MTEVSVIVPTFNRADSLRETLIALSNQTFDPDRYEVIVVDDCSSDDTASMVADFATDHPSLTLRYERHETNRLQAAARNTGAQAARGRLLAFVDDDIRPVPGWLAAHVEQHRSQTREVSVIGVVLYPLKWERRSNWVRFGNDNYRTSLALHADGNGVLPPNRFAGGNSSLRRDTFFRVGGFDERSRRAEDITMGCQLFDANVPLLCAPQALAYHHAEAILSIESTLVSFRRSYQYDVPAVQAKYPWYYEKYGHWFLQPPNPAFDGPSRRLVKTLVRLVARRGPQEAVLRILKNVDDKAWLYWRPLYQYVMACEAMDAMQHPAAPEEAGRR